MKTIIKVWNDLTKEFVSLKSVKGVDFLYSSLPNLSHEFRQGSKKYSVTNIQILGSKLIVLCDEV